MAAGAQLAPPDDYLSGVQPPAMPGIQGGTAAPAAAAPPMQGPPAALAPPAPQGGIAQGTGNSKGEIPTPTVEPTYDPKKLAKAQTPQDLLAAMTPKSRNAYMNWYEKTHGDIDAHYEALKTQLGARPSDDEPQTRQEKFGALLEFGLHLMKASAPASTNQGAVLSGTLSDENDAMQKAHQQKVAGEQGAYDTQAQGIESAHQAALKGIGTPADAMKSQLEADKADASELKDRASAYKDIAQGQTEGAAREGPATYAVGIDGKTLHKVGTDADGNPVATPVLGIDGKPFQGRVLGRATGSGVDKSTQDTAQIRNIKYLTGVLGVDKNTATVVAMHARTGNPAADHAAIYRTLVNSTLGDTDKAKRGADQYVLENYGADAIPRQNAPLVPNTPPPQALSGLKPNMVRDFGANGKWTVGIDGKPVRVGAGPTSVQ